MSGQQPSGEQPNGEQPSGRPYRGELSRHVDPNKLDNYASERGARAYRADYDNKFHRKLSDRLERRIFGRFLEQVGHCEQILDLPCGAGRLHSLLGQHTDQMIEADFSGTMLKVNREEHPGNTSRYLRCSALEIPLPDQSVDLTVSVRLSHHISTPEGRHQHLQELCRVSRKHVIVTWFSTGSIKYMMREMRRKLGSPKRRKSAMATRKVVGVMEAQGFRRIVCVPLAFIGSGHMFGLFGRG